MSDRARSVRRWIESHRVAVGGGAAVLCLVLAGVWLLVVPSEADATDGPASVVLRYGHSVVWLLLAVAAGLFALGAPRKVIVAAAGGALAVYVVFVAALVS